MSDLLEQERKKYSTVWANIPAYRYRSPGEFVARQAIERASMKPGEYVLDLGCGTGRAARIFQSAGMHVFGVDIAPECLDADLARQIPLVVAPLWDLPLMRGDHVFSADVLEHIPPEYVDRVLANIWASAHKAFQQIAYFEDSGWGVGDMHLTVESPDWWRNKLMRQWRQVYELDIPVDGVQGRSHWLCVK